MLAQDSSRAVRRVCSREWKWARRRELPRIRAQAGRLMIVESCRGWQVAV